MKAALLFNLAVGDLHSVAATHDEARATQIHAINNLAGVTWTAGVNPRFVGLPVGASKDMCGVKPGHKDHLWGQVASGKMDIIPKRSVDLPESFDSAEHWPECAKIISDIRDQSNCGCCWAFGAAEAASDRLCIATKGKVTVPLSAEETCFCGSDDGCDGGMLPEAWDYIKHHGLATGGQYKNTGPFGDEGLCVDFSLPHCHHHGPQGDDPYPAEGKPGCPSVTESPQCPTSCDADAKAPFNDFKKDRFSFTGRVAAVESDADAIAAEIMANGPVEAAFTVYADFENYVGGIYHATSQQTMGGHAIKIVGWGVEDGVKYWKVQNSWNPHWGEKGYFRIRRGVNECGIEEQVVANHGGSWTGPGTEASVLV
jgi:cathepsin B